MCDRGASAKHRAAVIDTTYAKLQTIGPWPGRGAAIAGDPQASEWELSDDGVVSSGIWECTPGVFRSAKDGVSEFMHFVAGDATITADDGTVIEVRPGVAAFFPDGWSGTWEIRQTVRKTYVTVTSPR